MSTEIATQGGDTAPTALSVVDILTARICTEATPAGRYAAIVKQRDADMATARRREALQTALAANQLLAMVNAGRSQVQIRAELAGLGVEISDSRISELIKLAKTRTRGGK